MVLFATSYAVRPEFSTGKPGFFFSTCTLTHENPRPASRVRVFTGKGKSCEGFTGQVNPRKFSKGYLRVDDYIYILHAALLCDNTAVLLRFDASGIPVPPRLLRPQCWWAG